MTNTQTTLPLSGLRLDPANVRTIGRGASPAFIANIKAMGVKLPLHVRPNGRGHLVTDGGKRLAALQALAEAGDIPADHPVPVIIADMTDAAARETSLALNIIREAMHPVDEFRAFAALHHDKEAPLDVDSIAAHFGVQRRQVEQSLALGSLHDAILDAWRDGKLDEEAAQAFTLCPNKKAQATLLAQIAKRQQVTAWSVKNALKIGHENAGRLLCIIGFDAYEKAGGKVTRDLFGRDHVVSDAVLLRKMVGDKVKATCDALIAAGWSWATSERPDNRWQYGRVEPKAPSKEQRDTLNALRNRLDEMSDEESPQTIELDAQIEALEDAIARDAYSAAQKKKAGCFVGINHRGDAIEIAYGQVKPTDAKQAKRDAKAAKPKGPPKLSNALRDRLRKQLLKGTRAALLAHKPANALAGELAKIIARQIDPDRPYGLPSQINNNLAAIRNAITPSVMDAEQRKAFDAPDYFSGVPKSFNLRAITEAINADESRKVAGKKKSEIAKFALANVGKTGWLPSELRTAHYKHPAKAKRK